MPRARYRRKADGTEWWRVRCLGPCRVEHWFWSTSPFIRVCPHGKQLQLTVHQVPTATMVLEPRE